MQRPLKKKGRPFFSFFPSPKAKGSAASFCISHLSLRVAGGGNFGVAHGPLHVATCVENSERMEAQPGARPHPRTLCQLKKLQSDQQAAGLLVVKGSLLLGRGQAALLLAWLEVCSSPFLLHCFMHFDCLMRVDYCCMCL